MSVDSLLQITLEKVGVPVERLKYTGREQTFITYQLVIGQEINFSDDDSQAEEYTYRVDIYSKIDYIALIRRIKTELKAVGFYAIVFDAEVYENDTGYYHIPIEIKYMEE